MKQKRSLLITVVTVLAGTLIGVYIWNRGQESEQPVEVTDFASCAEVTGVVMESYPRQCSYEGTTYVEELSEDGQGPDMSLPANEKALIESWLAENNYNEYGDPEDTAYIGGTPLFDESTGTYIDRYTYLLEQYPEKPWLEDSTETPTEDETSAEEPLPFTSVDSWELFMDPNFEFEYPAFVTVASANGYPIRMYDDGEFEFYVTVSDSQPSFEENTCTKTFEVGGGEAVYLCNNDSVKYSQIYQRMKDSFIAR